MTSRSVDAEVVVVGAGGAGLAAAVSAAAAGASVVVVEGSRQPGGSTALASGSFLAAGTAVQRAAGHVDDIPDELFRFWMLSCQWQADPAIVRTYCDRAPETLSWMQSLGVSYRPENLRATPLAEFPRAHRPDGGGQAIVDALLRAARDRDVDIALDNKVDRLVTYGPAVVGVEARGEELRAGAVVLTTGGFARNAELLADHFPDTAIAGDDLWSPAAPTCQGEGLRMAIACGASTDGTNRGEMVLSNGLLQDFEPYRPGWPIFVNAHGRRFVSEAAPNAAMLGVFRYQDGPVWAIFDAACCASAGKPVDPMYQCASWGPDAVAGGLRTGRVRTAGSIEGLAPLIGVRADALTATVEQYNADVCRGHDSRFLKAASDLRELASPPYYAVRIRPMIVPVTGYGVRIDTDAHVLATSGRPIPGLYAAGEIAGNVFGNQYVSHGQAIGTALVFGRIAGASAAAAQPL